MRSQTLDLLETTKANFDTFSQTMSGEQLTVYTSEIMLTEYTTYNVPMNCFSFNKKYIGTSNKNILGDFMYAHFCTWLSSQVGIVSSKTGECQLFKGNVGTTFDFDAQSIDHCT